MRKRLPTLGADAPPGQEGAHPFGVYRFFSAAAGFAADAALARAAGFAAAGVAFLLLRRRGRGATADDSVAAAPLFA